MPTKQRIDSSHPRRKAAIQRAIVRAQAATKKEHSAADIPGLDSKRRSITRKQLRKAVATIKDVPEGEISQAETDSFVETVERSAEAMADLVGRHLDGIVEHLKCIGCVEDDQIVEYCKLERELLISLYHETGRPCPSPTKLFKFALRYALDARNEIDGDIQRFNLRRQPTGWEIIDYVSPALKIAGIDKPGRLITNKFAVAILDFLQQDNPPFYKMRAFLEGVLDEIPEQKDEPERVEEGPDYRAHSIRVDLDKNIVWLIKEPIPVVESAAYFVDIVVAAAGQWVSSTQMNDCEKHRLMIGSRPDRVYRGLPPKLQALIESKGGKGFRLKGAC